MLKKGEFVMKGTDRKVRFDERNKQIEEVAQKEKEGDGNDDDDGDDEETEVKKFEHETRELESQLKKAE